MENRNRSKKIAVIGDTISSHPQALDGKSLPRSITGISNYPWLTSQLEKLGYSYSRQESLDNGLVVFIKD